MKNFTHILLISVIFIMCACSSVHSLRLDTIRPAKVEYHTSSPYTTVVNNCTIPDGSSYSRYIDENGKRYRLSYNADSIPEFFAMSVASRLYERNFFESVEVYLPDSSLISGTDGITQQMQQEWDMYYPDMVHILINEIKPKAIMQIEILDGIFGAALSLATSAQVQCCIPGESPTQIIVSDTLAWYAYGDTPEMARMDLPMFDICLEEALSHLSKRVADNLTPHKRVVERYIFVTGHVAMNDAYKYWQNKQYTDASYIWEYVFKNANNAGRKAKAAANLAVYYEIEDDYATAHKYAQQAHSLAIEAKDVYVTEYLNTYCRDLEERIEEKITLDRVLL